MEFLTLQSIAIPVVLILGGVVFGFVTGSKRAHRTVRRLERDLNRQRLAALDRNAELLEIERQNERCERLERVMRLILARHEKVNTRAKKRNAALVAREKQHQVEVTSLELQVAKLEERCETVTTIARRVTMQLKRAENRVSTTEQADTPALVSQEDVVLQESASRHYVEARRVGNRYVDRDENGSVSERVAYAPHRDSAAPMRPQANRDQRRLPTESLQVIRGIDMQTEQKLNAAGIHRVEQLATLSEVELADLRASMGLVNGHDHSRSWVGGARELMQTKVPVV